MELPIYENLIEKAEYFEIISIQSLEELNTLFEEHSNVKGIYRGIGSSQYKIFSSMQRQIIQNNLTDFSLDDYIKTVRNNKLLRRYFDEFEIPLSKLSIYSYLQHYGAPTPFLDFTTNFSSALFFATEKHDASKFTRMNDISDTFSLFYIQDEDLELLNIDETLEGMQKLIKLGRNMWKQYEGYTDELYIEYIDKLFDIKTLEIYLIENSRNLKDVYNTFNNIRIIAQDGLFICNNSLSQPLESVIKTFFSEATKYSYSPWDDDESEQAKKINDEYQKTLEKNRENQMRLSKNIIKSYEIDKELIPEIKSRINISRNDIYPKPEDLVWSLFVKAKK
jgi:hypothetical protein